MSRSKGKSRTEDAWVAWMKAQRKLLQAWTNTPSAGMPPWGPAAAMDSSSPYGSWLPPGFPAFPPWNAQTPFPTDFFNAASNAAPWAGGGVPATPWNIFTASPAGIFNAAARGGRGAPMAPWIKGDAGLPGAAEMFHYIPGAWLQFLLGLWPSVADALVNVSRQVPNAEHTGLDEWRQTLERALAEGKKALEAGEENARAFTTQLLSLGLPQPPGGGAEAGAAWNASRELLEQWLAMPAMGPYRAEQEAAAETMRLLLDLQDKARAHNELLAGMGKDIIDVLRNRLLTMLEEGKSLTSLREGFNLWVGCCERVYRERVMSDDYSKRYGNVVNASFRLRKHLLQRQQHWLESQGWPSRREIDAVLKQQRTLDERCNTLAEAQNSLDQRLDEMQGKHEHLDAELGKLRQEQQNVNVQLDTLSQEQRGMSVHLTDVDERLSQALDVLQSSTSAASTGRAGAEPSSGPGAATAVADTAYPVSVTSSEAAAPSSHTEPHQLPAAGNPAQDYWSSGRHD